MTNHGEVHEMQAIPLNSTEKNLATLLKLLEKRGYRFVTPTPASHEIVIRRPAKVEGRSLTDVFGWSLAFRREHIDPEILTLLEGADHLLHIRGDLWRSAIRVSSLGGQLFLHSAFPTDAHDAVFFGPDTYRFASAIISELTRQPLGPAATILDIGTGSGAGAMVAGAACTAAVIMASDINPKALEYARINAAVAGIPLQALLSSDLSCVDGDFDLILANPPYIADPAGRAYRDGGGDHGSGVALDMTQMALARLAPLGRYLLYTGSAIVDGEDRLRCKLHRIADEARCLVHYREIDPDVFGEELANPAYADVDRIAAVVAVFTAAGRGAARLPKRSLRD